MKQETNNTKTNVNCEVYVSTYHKYNCGSIQGQWVDLTQFENYEQFIKYCKELHKDETDPEFMYQDNCIDFVFHYMVGECGIDEKVFEAIELFSQLDNYQQEILTAFMDASRTGFFEALNQYEDYFVTDNLSDYAYEIVESYGLPEFAKNYFDYEKFERDLAYDFTIGSCNGKDFYFQN